MDSLLFVSLPVLLCFLFISEVNSWIIQLKDKGMEEIAQTNVTITYHLVMSFF